MKSYKYLFQEIEHCNMCGANANSFKILGKRMNLSQGLRPRKIGIATTIVKCINCNLIFSNPLPTPTDINKHYGINPDEYWNDNYFQTDKDYFVFQMKKYLELSDNVDGGGLRSLDIGAGIGKAMHSMMNLKFDVYGIEPSKSFFEMAIDKNKIGRDRINNCTIEEAIFEENSFDFITFGAVLEHLYDPSSAIEKALKWLKPGGLIQIEVPSSKWLTNRIVNVIYKLQGIDYVANLSPMHSPYHLYEFDVESFRKHSVKNNYTITFSRNLICNTFLPKVLDFVLKPIMKYTNTGMELEVWLRKH